MKKLFVVVTQPRSGSYLLVDLLNQVPGIKCHPELFKPGRLELDPGIRTYVNWTVDGRDKRPIQYMKAVLAIGDDRVAGFKLFPGHSSRLLSHIDSNREIHKVILLRHPLSRFVSLLRAEATGKWVQRKGDNSSGKGEIQCNFESSRFESFLDSHSRFSDKYLLAVLSDAESYTIVDYDEVASMTAVERICIAFGIADVANAEIIPGLQKQTKEPLPMLISNYREMKVYIQDRHRSILDQRGCPSMP